jgi:hypothetical protein
METIVLVLDFSGRLDDGLDRINEINRINRINKEVPLRVTPLAQAPCLCPGVTGILPGDFAIVLPSILWGFHPMAEQRAAPLGWR